MLFRDRGESQQLSQLATETTPYRNMAVDFEVEQRRASMDLQLGLIDRSLITSNDRFQLPAAYMGLASNRYMVANTICGALTDPEIGPDFKPASFSYDEITRFLVSSLRNSKEALETAEQVSSRHGYTAADTDVSAFVRAQEVHWPRSTSRNFLVGALLALDLTAAHTELQFQALTSSRELPNDFRIEIQKRVTPLINDMHNRRRAIERITGGSLAGLSSESIMQDVYDDIVAALKSIDEINIWITMPRIKNDAFRLREPYDETRPVARKFNPEILGSPAVTSAVRRPELPSGRPFDPSALAQPTRPVADNPRPFDPSVLKSGEKHQRPFDPDSLNQNDE